ncbi:MAG: phage holin family protein [Agarilytica sp.]
MIVLQIINSVLEFVDKTPTASKAFALAAVTAFLRVSLDAKPMPIARKFTESCFCGVLTLGLYYGSKSLGFSDDLGIFIGATIGCLGSMTVRDFAHKWASTKIK